MTCHACGAQLSSGARFCHKCGAAIATARSTGWRAGFPWALAGAALGALVTVVAIRGSGARSTEQQGDIPPAAPSSMLRAPDISQMSQQNGLTASSSCDDPGRGWQADSVQFFLPMALGPTVSSHSRCRRALSPGPPAARRGDVQGALAQADTIQRSVPTHYSFMYCVLARMRSRGVQHRSGARMRTTSAMNRPSWRETA